MTDDEYRCNDIDKLNRLLRQRDQFIVNQGLWLNFVQQLPAQQEPEVSDKITMEEIHEKFSNGAPLVVMKLLFPEHCKPMTLEELRYLIDLVSNAHKRIEEPKTLELHDLVLSAVIGCSHTIESGFVCLYYDDHKKGDNAYNQLHNRIKEVLGDR